MNHDDEDDSDKTPITCLACGGDYKTERPGKEPPVVWCRFCIEGVMTASQRVRWTEWSKKERAKRRGQP